MSEPGQQPMAQPQSGPSAGQLLRQARESAGLHIATLAVALKVPVRKLEALEEDRYDRLPDAVFVRALASSVCRTLKIDAQQVLDKLPQVATPRLVRQEDGINTPFRTPGEGPRKPWPDQVSKPVVATVVALLVGAVALVFLPERISDRISAAVSSATPSAPTTRSASTAPAPTAVATAPLAVAMPEPAASAPMADASAPASVPLPMAVPASGALASAGMAAPTLAAASAARASLAASAPLSAASAPAGPASGVVVFRATGESWVKVSDAKGTTVFQKLLTAGESAGANGALPLTVTVGSAKNTSVEVRGQPFDIASQVKDNVARFEIK